MKDETTGTSAWQRHRIRHTPTGLQFAFADSIVFLDGARWDRVSNGQSLFLDRRYLDLLETSGMENVAHRYALVHDGSEPVACVAVQLFRWRAESLLNEGEEANRFRKALRDARRSALQGFDQRLLVCGNLVSSGLHGVAFAPGVDAGRAWRGVAEALYRIRRGEKLSGESDFLLVKDFKGSEVDAASALENYSYRRVQTEPDMVLALPEACTNFDNYLALLNTKYRGKQKRIRRQIEDAGFKVETLQDVRAHDAEIHKLYCEVERRAAVRMAALPPGYFAALAERFPDRVRISVLRDEQRIAGFISTLCESDGSALAYYVGVDYAVNEELPVYLRLLQQVIEDALAMGCRKISFGRTAAEPKASLGAKPVDTWLWARHRLPAVNWFVRQLFPYLPYEEAPERSPFRES